MKYTDWVAEFKPVKNTLVYNSDKSDLVFSTSGPDFNHMWEQHQQKPDNVWTLQEMNGVRTITPGKKYANVLGYYITKIPCKKQITVTFPESLVDKLRPYSNEFNKSILGATP